MWRLTRLRRRWHPWRSVKKTLFGLLHSAIKLMIIVAVCSYGGVIFIHLTNGFSFQTSLAAGFQDARLLATCPRDTALQWQFIDRSQIEQVGLGVAIDMGEHVYRDICSNGALPSELMERGKRKSEARLKGLVTPQTTFAPPEALPILATSEPLPPVTPGLSQLSAPTLEDLRLHLLELINLDRAADGLSLVTLGDNPAAQQHAEEMLEHSYLSHWGLDGMAPYMRYTLAGGVNYEAENALGLSATLRPGGQHTPVSPKQELRKAEESWMSSPGHRRNILNPWHKKVNLGIACSRKTCAAVQQFEGDYIKFGKPPTIASSGLLSMTGTLFGGFDFSGIQIWYERLPYALTLGQLDRTYSYNLGEQPAAFIREPAPHGSFYNKSDNSTIFTWSSSRSPYDLPANTPRLGEGSSAPHSLVALSAKVPWVTARVWVTSGGRFQIEADLASVVADHGPGVYTVLVWGKADSGEEVALTRYAIFVG